MTHILFIACHAAVETELFDLGGVGEAGINKRLVFSEENSTVFGRKLLQSAGNENSLLLVFYFGIGASYYLQSYFILPLYKIFPFFNCFFFFFFFFFLFP